MKKRISLICLTLLMLNFQSITAQEDPCQSIDKCASSASEAYFPGYPMPITICPDDGGSSICCTTCNSEEEEKEIEG